MALHVMPDIQQAVQLCDMDARFEGPGVYFLWHGFNVVYVGQSRRIIRRITEHIVKAAKTFDRVSCIPCEIRKLLEVERFYIESLLPKYNRCGASQSIRRTWVGHMADRPSPDARVNSDIAAAVLGVTQDQLKALHELGLSFFNRRIPRSRRRRTIYHVGDLHQFAAQNAAAIIGARDPDQPPRGVEHDTLRSTLN